MVLVLPTVDVSKKNSSSGVKVLNYIAKGSQARVYRVEINGKECAMKQYMADGMGNPNELFKTELNVLQAVQGHKGIVTLVDNPDPIFYKNTFFMALGNESLYEWNERRIANRKAFTDEEFFDIAYQLYNVTNHIHNSGYVHRDIKPENILVMEKNKENNKVHLCVADLGLAVNLYEKTIVYGTKIFRLPILQSSSAIYHAYTGVEDLYSVYRTLIDLVTSLDNSPIIKRFIHFVINQPFENFDKEINNILDYIEVQLDNIRIVRILSHITKVLEQLEQRNSKNIKAVNLCKWLLEIPNMSDKELYISKLVYLLTLKVCPDWVEKNKYIVNKEIRNKILTDINSLQILC